MRSRLWLRRMRAAHVIIAATPLMLLASALALTQAPSAAARRASSPTGPGQRSAVGLRASPGRIQLGHNVTLNGRSPAGDAGQRAVLQALRRGSSSWSVAAVATIDRHGRFRFQARPRRSTLYRALVAASGATAAAPTPIGPASTTPSASAAPAAAFSGLRSSPIRPVTVLARFSLRRPRLELLGRGTVHLTGELLPARPGRRVALQRHTGAGWRTLGGDRTGRRGGFHLRYTAAASTRLRLRFGGDRRNGRAVRAVGTVIVLHQAVASWYQDGGATACGFHAALGVANRTLPCGTRVEFRHGNRRATAIVDDRGPFVAGREWDLSQSTAAALGFSGVGTVWASSG